MLELREMEKGVHPGPVCVEFRPLLFSGVLCWCGRLRGEHRDQAPETALRLLAFQDRNRRLAHLSSRVSGRSFRDLARELGSVRAFGFVRARGNDPGPEVSAFMRADAISGCAGNHDFFAGAGPGVFFRGQVALVPELGWSGGYQLSAGKDPAQLSGETDAPDFLCGENGEGLQPSACHRYRPLLSKENKSCWCGHLSVAHGFVRAE